MKSAPHKSGLDLFCMLYEPTEEVGNPQEISLF